MDLIKPGKYRFEVLHATNKVSAKGNEMILMKIRIWDEMQIERIVWDRIMQAYPSKIRSFAEATDLMEQHNFGALLPEDCIGKKGWLNLIIEHDDTNTYPDKNGVKDYVKETVTIPDTKVDFIDDDIPF